MTRPYRLRGRVAEILRGPSLDSEAHTITRAWWRGNWPSRVEIAGTIYRVLGGVMTREVYRERWVLRVVVLP